ncbi:uncharacterized protein LOC114746577 [Neltuma alba]|uniref:uncharacterized protein LOC114746249 n=1 Tax=Neltuma alba TaxID=207710 RepID=UPI0010A580FC|nr:uncharacterized protein LOC114746249 [Prosopis alba]XP_028790631.1 uncharacterized protein LOC114746577 [Prosopis alba]
MAYVPPHKRHSKDKDAPLPSPELLPSHSKKNPNLTSRNSYAERSGKIIYAEQAISKWFAVGLDDTSQLPPFVHLCSISLESIERKIGEKPLILVESSQLTGDTGVARMRCPAEIITENVLQDLLSSFDNVRSLMQVRSFEEVKPTLVARFGKVLFHGRPSAAQEAMQRGFAAGIKLGDSKRSFYTNIPTPYMEKITSEESPNIGFDFAEEKDVFHVKLSDTNRPDATISCKCRVVKEHSRLQMYKIELNQVRHMVTDISSLIKNLDLRLMLCTKRILTSLKDDEMQCIQDLIHSAILDPNVKGGLRWTLGKTSSGDRFSVVGVWHTITKAYRTPSLRLKVRHADRFDLRMSTGESASEAYLKLKGIVSELQVEKVDVSLISEMLKQDLRLIWDHFLNCEHFLG